MQLAHSGCSCGMPGEKGLACSAVTCAVLPDSGRARHPAGRGESACPPAHTRARAHARLAHWRGMRMACAALLLGVVCTKP